MAEEIEKKMAVTLKDREILSMLEGIFIIFEQAGNNLNKFAESAEKTVKKSAELNKDLTVFLQLLETLNQSLDDFQNAQADKIKSAGQKLKNGLAERKLIPVYFEPYENNDFSKDFSKDRADSALSRGFKKTSENLAAPLNISRVKNKSGENTEASFGDSSKKHTAFDKAAEGILKLEKFLDDKSKLLEIAKVLPLLPFLSLLDLLLRTFKGLSLVDLMSFLGALADGNQAAGNQAAGNQAAGNQAAGSQGEKEKYRGKKYLSKKHEAWASHLGGRANSILSPESQNYSKKGSNNKTEKEAEIKSFRERLNPAWTKGLKNSDPKEDKHFLDFEYKLGSFLSHLNADSLKEKWARSKEYYESLSLLLDSLKAYSLHSQAATAAMSAMSATTKAGKDSALSSNSYSFKSQDTINVHSPTGDLEQISKELKNRIFDRSLAGIANSCNYLG